MCASVLYTLVAFLILEYDIQNAVQQIDYGILGICVWGKAQLRVV